MEFDILHAIQGMHTSWLNPIMIFVSALGNAGILWIALSVILAIPKRTRVCGITMMIAMALSFILGNLIIKNIVARPRPYELDASVALLIKKPREYSFPSGHTLNGFTASTVLFLYYKRAGIAALLFAAVIAFSRMYLFVHYPTDILAGMLLGIFDAVVVYFIVKKVRAKVQK